MLFHWLCIVFPMCDAMDGGGSVMQGANIGKSGGS